MDEENLVVQDGWVVSLEYTLRFDDGELVASSAEDGLLAFIQGRGHVFPVIEKAVAGLRVGDELDLVLPPDETYGEYDPEAIELLPLDEFPEGLDVQEGLEIELYDEDSGAEFEAVVVEVRDDGVVVDLNHPLAGETLRMHLRVAGVRPATDEEIAHDHVHEDGPEEGTNGDYTEFA